jgi:hypothetical protein
MDVTHGGKVEVGDVHTDLGTAVGEDTNGLDSVESAVSGPNVAGDGAGGGDVGTFEMDVVSNEKAAGSDGAGPGGLVQFRAADVRAACCVAASRFAKTFKLTLADVFEKDAVRASGRSSLKIYGDAVTTPDEKTSLTR